MTLHPENVMTQLQPVRQALEADGYELACLEASADQIVLQVSAGPGVCEDCLVPKAVLGGMVATRLEASGLASVPAIAIRYPDEH